METRDFITDNQIIKVIYITNEEINQQKNTIQVNDEIAAIVPVQTKVASQPKSLPSKGYQWREQKMNTWRYLMAAGMIAGLVLHGLIRFGGNYNIGSLLFGEKALAQTVASKYSNLNHSVNLTKQAKTANKQPIAVKYVNGAPTPDWSNITFKNMKFGEGGSVEFPNINNPGMKESRTWSAGQSLSEVMELGDFEATEFNIEDFTLEDIANITGIKLKDLKLSDFETLKWQTLEDLALSIPNLEDLEVGAIPPIQELVTKVTGNAADYQTVGEVLDNYPELGEAELGKYVKLDKYKLTSIPGIEDAQLKDFTNWQNTTIDQVPGLVDVPFDQFPNVPIPDVSFIGKVDLPLGSLESGRWKSISGSYQAGFNVSCEKRCGHIEVSGSDIVVGAQWMSGKDQKVKGGFGILGNLNGGKEPTGRHPFGKSFKQVIWDINEADGSISTAMFFRICKRGWIDLGCSPYFIGPVPFFTYREIDPIILGTPLSVPKKVTP
ncbi:hypothetical protein CEN49_00560 [Fischerella thermalis CCMEE 5273]|uniref:Uncharacterized protein n=1 Tax=Chlorogloeopsis fritschii PCC 6912 TaxID=211165 RepID=A0A3S0Y417_CHLFR|nr:hypothetical protein [Chlorogloeopsis fritschii]PMB11887.1 hypothetical protein CEN49_00560 [Fischerella thermalis CCMEE 5273]PMB43309.1 hypothetical protein CEN40_16145 [Fischerella thermalis CCMEE 5205]RUR83800.1 hypothetical protein PCC6912_20430 [Chlorogloeopsis fritschii PCC 6912]